MYAPAIGRASLTERTVLAGREVFLGRRRGPLAMLPFVGPAVIASIAYRVHCDLAVLSARGSARVALGLRSVGSPVQMRLDEPQLLVGLAADLCEDVRARFADRRDDWSVFGFETALDP